MLSIFRYLFGKPRSFTVGERFESYARNVLFTNYEYSLLQKTHKYGSQSKTFVSSSDPDFKFRDRVSNKVFYLEAKFRKYFYRGQLTWCTDKQLATYRQCNREAPVFVLIGVGGTPNRPQLVALIPLNKINFTILYQSFVAGYSIQPSRKLPSRLLWRR